MDICFYGDVHVCTFSTCIDVIVYARVRFHLRLYENIYAFGVIFCITSNHNIEQESKINVTWQKISQPSSHPYKGSL